MKKLWNWLFPVKINPKWCVVEAYRGEWIIHNNTDKQTQTCNYQIEYSEVLNEYRLISSGYDAKSHATYTDLVVPAFNKLVNAKNKNYESIS